MTRPAPAPVVSIPVDAELRRPHASRADPVRRPVDRANTPRSASRCSRQHEKLRTCGVHRARLEFATRDSCGADPGDVSSDLSTDERRNSRYRSRELDIRRQMMTSVLGKMLGAPRLENDHVLRKQGERREAVAAGKRASKFRDRAYNISRVARRGARPHGGLPVTRAHFVAWRGTRCSQHHSRREK